MGPKAKVLISYLTFVQSAATMHLKNTPSPIIAPIAPPLPEKLTTSPTYSRPSVWSPGQAVSVPAPPLPSVDKTTAEDLLKGFMDPSRLQDLTKAKTPPNTSIPPPFLPGNNIWSASQDEQALRYTTASGPQTISPITPHMKQRNLSASQDFSSQQSIWPFPVNQYPQNHPPGLSSSSAFSNYPTFPVGSDSSHQRVPYASADAHFFHSNLSRNVGMGLAGTGNVPHLSQLDQAGIGVNSYPRMHPDSLHNTFDTPQNFRPHARHLSFQSPSASAMPSMSSIWGNNG
ncbi:hypothetical protein GYMLUDRAFT_214852 [Collybiopsis luxurians FD-317 M1]|nr:hypothetical protein GYMLUDRAFT_214852 [Collybiopsis luxurians FD-317 M1]